MKIITIDDWDNYLFYLGTEKKFLIPKDLTDPIWCVKNKKKNSNWQIAEGKLENVFQYLAKITELDRYS